MEWASGRVDGMRRDGASSAMRSVSVRIWRDGTKLADAPVLFAASYYDHEQGLTDAEVYAARVHDWHAVSRPTERTLRPEQCELAARPSDHWGPRADSCPACGGKFSAGVPTTVSGNAVRFPVGQQISRRERLDRATELARLMHGAGRDPKLGIERDQK